MNNSKDNDYMGENDMGTRELHPLEIKVLLRFDAGQNLTRALLVQELGFKEGQANQALSWLSAKGLVKEISRTARVLFEITDAGREAAKKGAPEERILELLEMKSPMGLPDIARELSMEPKDAGSAFGGLSKEGALFMDAEKRAALAKTGKPKRLQATRALLERAMASGSLDERELSKDEREAVFALAKKRAAGSSFFRLVEREEIAYAVTPEGGSAGKILKQAGAIREEAGALTPEMLKSGEWKSKTFRRYSINVPPQRVLAGMKNPYCSFLDSLKDKLCSLGFLWADRQVGFNEVNAHVMALFYYLSLKPELVAVEDPRFIPGRTAEIRVAGKPVGIMGEIHPQCLENWSIQMPCAAAEICLDALR